MAAKVGDTFPQIPPVARDNIPSFLQELPQWVLWRAGPLKPDGKFDKIPTCPKTGHNINGQNPANWLSYDDAIDAYSQGKGNGVGFVMSSKNKVSHNGGEYYLTAIDCDRCAGRMTELQELWLRLGKPYVEASPSGKGLRMFALSTQLLKGGNDGNGHEIYCSGQFVTVTGNNARGQIKDATAQLIELDRLWFGKKKKKKEAAEDALGSNIVSEPPPETAENILRVVSQLSAISSDTDYATWRNIVWSVLWTGWSCAEDLARNWSMKAEGRYDGRAFDTLVESFDPSRGLTLGTLYHHAMQNGWKPPANKLHVAAPAVDLETRLRANPLLTADEVKALPSLPYRIRGLLPAKGVAAIFGDPGSGKSFLALDMCFAIAAGHPEWFGMKVKSAPVVYVALEGRGGFSKRLKAWEAHRNQTAPDKARFLLGAFSLLEKKHAYALAEKVLKDVGRGGVVVVDTLNQSAPGADENSSADMGKILDNAKTLAEQVHGLVILIHHSGKDQSRGLRGHSSMTGAMDAIIKVTTAQVGRSWAATKTKDDEGHIGADFELVPYTVGVDEDGFDVTSCAVRPAINLPVPKGKPITGKHQIAAMAALRPCLASASKGIPHGEAVEKVASILTVDQKRKMTVAKETIDRLLQNGHLVLGEGGISLPS